MTLACRVANIECKETMGHDKISNCQGISVVVEKKRFQFKKRKQNKVLESISWKLTMI